MVVGTIVNELHGHPVHTIAQSRWCRSVGKDMAKMTVAICATYFGPLHEQFAVGVFGDAVFVCRCIEAGPASAGIKFGRRLKQRFSASGTNEYTFSFFRRSEGW